MVGEDGRFLLELAVPARTAALVLDARGWTREADPEPRINGVLVVLRFLGERAIASVPLTLGTDDTVRVCAATRPDELHLRSSLMPTLPSSADAILPQALLLKNRAPVPGSTERIARMDRYIALGQVEAAMAEVAEAFLAGPEADGPAVALPLIAYLARHPLHRPSALGALLAALCTNRISI